MVIEVQFSLKSYAWFQNQTSAQHLFDLKSKYDFTPKLQNPNFNSHFITQFNSLNTRIINYKILVSTIIYWTNSQFVKKRNQKCVYVSFWKHVNIMSTWCDCVMWLVVLFYCLILIGWTRCNLEQIIVQFVNQLHRWEQIRLQG